MARVSPMMLLPVAIFAGFAAMAGWALLRDDPDSLPSAIAGREAREGDGGVEVVEAAQRPAAQHQLGRGEGVRAVGRDHRHVRLRHAAAHGGQRRIPVVIQRERAAGRQGVQVAVLTVVRHVALEEHEPVAGARERGREPAPERRVPVPPRRGHREPEDDELHPTPAGRPPPGGAPLHVES